MFHITTSGRNLAATRMCFLNNDGFCHSGTADNSPVSPLNRADALNFQEGFYLRTSDRRIPATGTIGLMIADTLDLVYNELISYINVFIALNHTAENSLTITLHSLTGQSAELYDQHSLVSGPDKIVAVFDDQADSVLVSGGFVPFSPVKRSSAVLNTSFAGIGTSGKWRLLINDMSANDTGRRFSRKICYLKRRCESGRDY